MCAISSTPTASFEDRLLVAIQAMLTCWSRDHYAPYAVVTDTGRCLVSAETLDTMQQALAAIGECPDDALTRRRFAATAAMRDAAQEVLQKSYSLTYPADGVSFAMPRSVSSTAWRAFGAAVQAWIVAAEQERQASMPSW